MKVVPEKAKNAKMLDTSFDMRRVRRESRARKSSNIEIRKRRINLQKKKSRDLRKEIYK